MKPLTISLFCCVLLVVTIFAEVTYYSRLSSVPPRPDSGEYRMETQDTDRELEFPPMSSFREIVERPLFNPSRRAIVASVKLMPLYRFRGALLMGKRRIGLLERRSNGVLLRVREGDVVDGWQIAFIDSRAIQMSSPTQTHTMTLEHTLAEGVLFDDIQQNEEHYKQNTRQEGRKQENNLSSNSKRRNAHGGRTCLQHECPTALSETRTMKHALAALIARLPAPPPPPDH